MTHCRAIKEETIAIYRDWVYNQTCRVPNDIHAIQLFIQRFIIFFELITKIRVCNDSFEFINEITIKCWLLYALSSNHYDFGFNSYPKILVLRIFHINTFRNKFDRVVKLANVTTHDHLSNIHFTAHIHNATYQFQRS